MAVIKIVPMPGAVGDKGDEGAVGPRGPQGEQGLQGPAGADALWNYNGEYNPGAGYAVGDVVTFEGQTWYRKNSNGGNVGDTPSEGLFWDLVAAKGTDGTPLNFWNFIGDPGVPTEDGLLVVDGISGRSETGQGNVSIFAGPTASVVLAGNGGEFLKDTNIPENQIATIGDVESQLNYWDGVETPQDPAQDGFLILDGIVTGLGSNLLVSAADRVFIGGNNGEFLNGLSTPENQIATIGDIEQAIETGPSEVSFTVNGGTLGTQPTFNGAPLFSGSYVKTGPMVHFQVQVDMDNITNFGTGQYFIDLPFPAKYGYQVKQGCLHDDSSDKQYAIGGHVFAGQSQLALTFTNSAGQDEAFDFNSPVTLNVADNFHIAGTYITS